MKMIVGRVELLLTQPTINCHQCYMLYNNDAIEPMCKTVKGCPIDEELATSPVVNEVASSFILAKKLHLVNKIDSLYVEQLKDLGLWQERELLVDLETTFYKNYEFSKQDRYRNRSDRRRDSGVGAGDRGSYC